MAILILTVFTGIIFAFLATQNTQAVVLNANGYVWELPLYLVALGAFLVGLLISSVFNIVDSISAMFTIQDKDSKIKASEKTVEVLESKIHDLELENAELRGQKGEMVEKEKAVEKEHHPSLASRLQHKFAQKAI